MFTLTTSKRPQVAIFQLNNSSMNTWDQPTRTGTGTGTWWKQHLKWWPHSYQQKQTFNRTWSMHEKKAIRMKFPIFFYRNQFCTSQVTVKMANMIESWFSTKTTFTRRDGWEMKCQNPWNNYQACRLHDWTFLYRNHKKSTSRVRAGHFMRVAIPHYIQHTHPGGVCQVSPMSGDKWIAVWPSPMEADRKKRGMILPKDPMAIKEED